MIHQIQIQNFKSLRNVTVDLSPVTVFIGKSGTGKTNFASAIRFLRDYLALGAPQAAQLYPACRCLTNPSGNIQFKVVFEVPGFTELFTYTLDLGENIHYPRLESLECGSTSIFSQAQTDNQRSQRIQWVTAPALISVPQPGAAALGRLPGLEEAVVAHTALTTAIGVYTFPYDVLKASVHRNSGSGLADNGQDFLEVIGDIARDLHKSAVRKAIAASLRRINETVVSVDLDSIQNPRKALVGHRFGGKTLTLDLDQESDGFRRFYAYLLALYQLPYKQTLVFEEPENGIYPGALSLLSDEFRAAPDAGRGQVLLTTHSPALLDCFAEDQIRVVDLVDLETRIGQLAQEQKEAIREQLLHTGELLTADPARRQEE
jgi:predicted ATPase